MEQGTQVFFWKTKVLKYTFVKQNKPMGRYQTLQKAGAEFMGGEVAFPTNPEKDRADKFKINM